MKEVFDRIDNRTSEELEEMRRETEEKDERDRFAQVRNDAWQFIMARDEDHATEEIVRFIEGRNNIYTTRDDIKSEIWIYDSGIYKPNGESYIREVVRSILLHSYTPQRANKVTAKIEADTMIDADTFFKTMYLNEICVENGILDLNTRILTEFTPDKIFFSKLPVEYNKDAVCPNIDIFFGEVLREEEDKKVLFELTGFCLHKEYFIEKAFMFLGAGRNGKGKTLGLLKNFLGTENTCSVRLAQMESDSSGLCELHNRLVNLAGDLDNTALKNTGLFKELTGRDSVQVKRKYLRDLIFTNYAKMVFACNELPRVYDLSEGFWSRWILLEFPYQFLPQKDINDKSGKERELCKIQDPLILDKLTTPEELSGLLNSAIEGLDRLKKNKDFSHSKGTVDTKDFWIRNSDSFTAFCLDELEEGIEDYVSKKDLLKMFVTYCRKHKVKGCSEKNIKIVLENMFGVIQSRKGSSYETQEAVWEGIKLKENDNSKGSKGFSTTLGNTNYSTSKKTLPTLPISKSKEQNNEVITKLTKEEAEKTGLEEEYEKLGAVE